MWFFFLLWLVSFCVYFLIQDLFLLISFTDSFDHLSLKPSREHFIFCKLLPLIAALDNVSYFFFPSQWIQKDCPLLFTLQRMGSISQGGDLQHQSWACLPLPFCHITTWKASQFFFSLQKPPHPLSVSYHFAFSYCSWSCHSRILKWFAIPFSSGPHSVTPLHHDPPVLGGPTGRGLDSLS